MKQLRDFYSEIERKRKAKVNNNKELLKAKKQIKDREREIIKLNDHIKVLRL